MKSYFKSAYFGVSIVLALLAIQLIYYDDEPYYNFVNNPVLTGKIFIVLSVIISACYFISKK